MSRMKEFTFTFTVQLNANSTLYGMLEEYPIAAIGFINAIAKEKPKRIKKIKIKENETRTS